MSFSVDTVDNDRLDFVIYEDVPSSHHTNRVEITHSVDGIVGIFDAVELMAVVSGTQSEVWAVPMSRPFNKLMISPRGPAECTLDVFDTHQSPAWKAAAKYRLTHSDVTEIIMPQLRNVVYRTWNIKVSATAQISAAVEQALKTLANTEGVTIEGLFVPTL